MSGSFSSSSFDCLLILSLGVTRDNNEPTFLFLSFWLSLFDDDDDEIRLLALQFATSSRNPVVVIVPVELLAVPAAAAAAMVFTRFAKISDSDSDMWLLSFLLP